jgi:hypothetical protein
MGLLKTVKEIITDSIFESREDELRMLRKVFQYDTNKLYSFLSNRGTLDDFIDDIISSDDDENRELHRLIINSLISVGDKERLIKYTLFAFNDLEVKGDDIVMTLDSKKDLAQFFYNDRDISTSTIESILSGEIDNYYDIDATQSDIEYMVDDLNEKNLKHLKSLMVEYGMNKTVEYDGDNEILEDIINSDEGKLTQDGLDEIFRSTSNIVDACYNIDIYENLKSNLNRIYSYSNESAISDELYTNIHDAIEDFFGDRGEEVNTGIKKHVTRKDGSTYQYDKYVYEIKVTNLYPTLIEWWTDQDYHDLDYWGSFEEMLKEYCEDLTYHDSMTFRYPDYADSKLQNDNANDMFLDYIED